MPDIAEFNACRVQRAEWRRNQKGKPYRERKMKKCLPAKGLFGPDYANKPFRINGGERGIRTLEIANDSATCRKHIALSAARAMNAAAPCPILPDD
jgi:hypothetical protein